MKKLTLFKAPQDISFSENEIEIGFHLSKYKHSSELREKLAIEIHVEEGGFGTENYQLKKRLNFSFDTKGVALFSIHQVLKYHLEQDYPEINNANPIIALKASKRYRIYAYYFNRFSSSAKEKVFDGVVVKGGVEKPFEQQINSYISLIFQFNRPLSNHTKLERVKMDQNILLSVLTKYTSNRENQKVILKIKGLDNTLLHNQSFTFGRIYKGQVIHFVLKMDDYLSGVTEETPLKIEIYQEDDASTPNEILCVEHQVFVLPDLLVKEDTVMHYENSIGGISSILFSGGTESMEYDNSLIEVVDNQAYLSHSLLNASKRIYNAKRSQNKSIDTGFIAAERIKSYQDLFLSENVFIEQKKNASDDSYLNPFVMKSGDLELYKIGEEASRLTIKLFNENTSFYTDRMKEVSAETCPLPLFIAVTQTEYNTADVSYHLGDGVFKGVIRYGTNPDPDHADNKEVIVHNTKGVVKVPLNDVVLENNLSYLNVSFWIKSICQHGESSYKQLSPNVGLGIGAPLQVSDLFTTVHYNTNAQELMFGGTNDFTDLITNPNPWTVGVYVTDLPAMGASPLIGDRGGELNGLTGSSYTTLLYKPSIQSGVEKFTFNVGCTYVPDGIIPPTGTLVQTPVTLYIEVKPAVLDNQFTRSVFVRLRETSTKLEGNFERVPVGPISSDYKNVISSYRLEYFSDPYGVNPINVDGMGIQILYKKTIVDNLAETINVVDYVVTASGTGQVIPDLIKREYKLDGTPLRIPIVDKENSYELKPSPEYQII